MKIPRGDINGVGEDEVTITSGLHAQAERTNKQGREGYIVTESVQKEQTDKQKREGYIRWKLRPRSKVR